MDSCEHAEYCRFYNRELSDMPADAEKMTEEYCNNNPLRCARSMIFDSLGKEAVPGDLMPDNKPEAYLILAGSST